MKEYVNYDLKRDWMPSYCLRRSKKAKYVHFRMNPTKGLEIVLPYRLALKHLPEVVDKYRPWIEEQEKKRLINCSSSDLTERPSQLNFHAIDKIYTLHYLSSNKSKLILRPNNELLIMYTSSQLEEIHLLLKSWVKTQAKIHLTQLFIQIAQQHSFKFQRVTVREQKNRWGSCSAKGHINLNYKLLFLSPKLCQHVILHELCHLIHFNHSKEFWTLLSQYDPHWQENNKATKRDSTKIPLWLN